MSLDHEATVLPSWASTCAQLDALDDEPELARVGPARAPRVDVRRHKSHGRIYLSGKLFGGRRAVINP